VRVSVTRFFSSRSIGLVGEHIDDLVLDCYRLARYYHQSPLIFLDMPLSEVRLHLERTIALAKMTQPIGDDDG
jgi:hypothetical protein